QRRLDHERAVGERTELPVARGRDGLYRLAAARQFAGCRPARALLGERSFPARAEGIDTGRVLGEERLVLRARERSGLDARLEATGGGVGAQLEQFVGLDREPP